MPIHKVKGGYKWGGHGHVYPTRKGAERQAAAAYAHGYTGKAVINRLQTLAKHDPFAEFPEGADETGYDDLAGDYGDEWNEELDEAGMGPIRAVHGNDTSPRAPRKQGMAAPFRPGRAHENWFRRGTALQHINSLDPEHRFRDFDPGKHARTRPAGGIGAQKIRRHPSGDVVTGIPERSLERSRQRLANKAVNALDPPQPSLTQVVKSLQRLARAGA